ncbi:MAG: Co2+/Mg2+ efflux protein ApaG [Chryseobacterium sp.]|nr:MAG: Co2+/Mg2+ efflux protein ApaG [Chryseobacterium sp.]
MTSLITQSIRVTASPSYDARNSSPEHNNFFFMYHIFIENMGNDDVKVLRRRWTIYDVGYGFSNVDGEGVIGLTPEISPNNEFNYFSNVALRSGIGYMSGSYTLLNMVTGVEFEVRIPRFILFADCFLN